MKRLKKLFEWITLGETNVYRLASERLCFLAQMACKAERGDEYFSYRCFWFRCSSEATLNRMQIVDVLRAE